MAIYHIEAAPRMSPKNRVLGQFVYTLCFLALFAGILRIIDRHWMHPTLLAILGGMHFLGNLLTSFLWKRKQPTYDLEIDDNEIRMLWSGSVVRKVRKDHIRYVGESGKSAYQKLIVSEQSSVVARLGAGIRVPASLPDYEQIKAMSFSWLERVNT